MTTDDIRAALQDLATSLDKRAAAAGQLAKDHAYAGSIGDYGRCAGKAEAYAHAAELVRAELAQLVG